jgi:hypothetical protein
MDFIDLKKKYKNLTTGTKMITAYLKTVEINTKFQNDDLKMILSLHPNNEKNGIDMEYFMVKLNIYNDRELNLKMNDKIIQSVSYKLCLRRLYDKPQISNDKIHRNNVLMSLRNAIYNGKRADFVECQTKIDGIVNGVCSICNSDGNMEIDHYGLSFQEIVDNFFDTNNFKYDDISVFANKKINNWYMELKDPLILDRWVQYHDDIAIYRLLCKKCNCSIGSSGYKPKVFI